MSQIAPPCPKKPLSRIAPPYPTYKTCFHIHIMTSPQTHCYFVTNCNSSYGNRSFSVTGPKLLNRIPSYITLANDIDSFKKLFKTYLFNLSAYEIKKLVV